MTVSGFPLTSDPPFSSTTIDIGAGRFDYDPTPIAFSPNVSPGDYSDEEDEEEDEDEHNHRVAPHWESYRHLLESRGYHLDTCRDVRRFYLHYWKTRNIQQSLESCAGYRSACREGRHDNELCKDEGLVSARPRETTSLLPTFSTSVVTGPLAVIHVFDQLFIPVLLF